MTRSGSRVLVEIHIMADKSKSLRESSWITIIFLLILVQKTPKISWKAANYLDLTFFPTQQCFSRLLTTIHWLFKAVRGIYFVPGLFPISRTSGHPVYRSHPSIRGHHTPVPNGLYRYRCISCHQDSKPN